MRRAAVTALEIAPHRLLGGVDREVEGVARVRGGLGDDDGRRTLERDVDLADDVHPVLRAVDVVEAHGDALEVDGELAELAPGAITDIVLDAAMERDLVRADVERRLARSGSPDLALVVLPDGSWQWLAFGSHGDVVPR